MTNRIIVPANYNVEIIIKLDPIKGQSELQIRNRSNVQLSMWQVVGLLSEHTTTVLRSLLMGKAKLTPVEEKLEEVAKEFDDKVVS